MDPVETNQIQWDLIARAEDEWFQAVTPEQIAEAKAGLIRIQLTAQKQVPESWLHPIRDKRVLCLAAAGGKQAPLLAAAGADVVVFDISPLQLERDRQVAVREQLEIETVQGDMNELSFFEDESFDLIVNPCSVCYCPHLETIWREAHRVVKAGGSLLTGLINPVNYLFDAVARDEGELIVRHPIPYSDLVLSEEERLSVWGLEKPIDFGHSLDSQIGGLLRAGFQITGFYEDRWGGEDILSEYLDVFCGVKATKP